jgi:hypothetical protein
MRALSYVRRNCCSKCRERDATRRDATRRALAAPHPQQAWSSGSAGFVSRVWRRLSWLTFCVILLSQGKRWDGVLNYVTAASFCSVASSIILPSGDFVQWLANTYSPVFTAVTRPRAGRYGVRISAGRVIFSLRSAQTCSRAHTAKWAVNTGGSFRGETGRGMRLTIPMYGWG